MAFSLRAIQPVRRTLFIGFIVALSACGGSSTSPSTVPGSTSTMTATINGKSFAAVVTIGLRTSGAVVPPNGTVGVTGTGGFTVPYTIVTVTVPAVVGTYPLSSTGTPLIQNAEVEDLNTTTSGQIWTAGAAGSGGSGSITLSTLTSTGASGTFSFTATATTATGAAGTKVVTNGKFNVKF